jgi:lipooligosaccharide transport system permease protein
MRSYLPRPQLAYRVWRRDLRVFSKLWKGALLPTFLDPVFYLLAMGFGLGTYLASINGIPYKNFIASGLVASAAMWATAFETTYNVYFRMSEYRLYDNMLSTPVEVEDLVAGEMAWACTRALIYATVFLGIVAAFGLVESPWAIVTPLFVILGAACFAAIGLSFTSIVGKVDYFTYYYTLFVTPMFLFGGIFYPLDRLPQWTHVVAWFTPLYHLVLITRGLILGPDALSILGNALWLLVLTTALFAVPVIYMRRRLVM